MPTARELLEQADALMRRNRSLASDDIPVLTEAVPAPPDIPRGRGAQEPTGATDVADAAADAAVDADADSIPTLTERVETMPASLVSPDEGGDPSQWLEREGEASITGDVPDSVLVVPGDEDASLAAEAPILADPVAPAALRTRSRGIVGPEAVTETLEVVAPFSTGAEDAFDEEFARAAQMVDAEAAEEASEDHAGRTHDDVPSPEQVEAEREMSSLASFAAGSGSFERWRAFDDAAPGAVDPDTFLPAVEAPVSPDAAPPSVDEFGLEIEPQAPAPDAFAAVAGPSLPALNEALEEVEPPLEVIDIPAPAVASLAQSAASLAQSRPSFAPPEPPPAPQEPSSPPSDAHHVPSLVAAAPASVPLPMTAAPPVAELAPPARDDAKWEGIAEEIRMQVLQRIDIFTDTGLREQLAVRLQPIVDRASADLVATINRHVGELLRSYVAEAIEREIESWRRSH